MTLSDLESLALAAMPAGGGDVSSMLDACSPETVLALVAVARTGLAWMNGRNRDIIGTAPPGGERSETGKALYDALAALKEVMR